MRWQRLHDCPDREKLVEVGRATLASVSAPPILRCYVASRVVCNKRSKASLGLGCCLLLRSAPAHRRSLEILWPVHGFALARAVAGRAPGGHPAAANRARSLPVPSAPYGLLLAWARTRKGRGGGGVKNARSVPPLPLLPAAPNG
jgi:hypothetical protein